MGPPPPVPTTAPEPPEIKAAPYHVRPLPTAISHRSNSEGDAILARLEAQEARAREHRVMQHQVGRTVEEVEALAEALAQSRRDVARVTAQNDALRGTVEQSLAQNADVRDQLTRMDRVLNHDLLAPFGPVQYVNNATATSMAAIADDPSAALQTQHILSMATEPWCCCAWEH